MSYPIEVYPEEFDSFIDALQGLPDGRDNRGKRHSMAFILSATLLGIMSGRSTVSSLYRYILNNIEWLREVTGKNDADPISRAHLPRLLGSADWLSIDRLALTYLRLHLFPAGVEKEWVAIDGKVLRGTLKSGEKQTLVHAVTHDSRTELAQARQCGNKSSEIPVVRHLLKQSGLDKQKVTLDAHHCNPQTTAQIASAGGEYLIQVKKNQPTLLKQCQELEVLPEKLFHFETHEKAHGRLTSRYASVYSMEVLTPDERWKGSHLRTMIAVTRHTLEMKKNKHSEETSYYINNHGFSEKDREVASERVEAIRRHWGVESNNWVLDVTFQEDKVVTKNANQSHIMGRLRGIGLQIFRRAGVKNFQAAMEFFCDSRSSMVKLLRQVKFL